MTGGGRWEDGQLAPDPVGGSHGDDQVGPQAVQGGRWLRGVGSGIDCADQAVPQRLLVGGRLQPVAEGRGGGQQDDREAGAEEGPVRGDGDLAQQLAHLGHDGLSGGGQGRGLGVRHVLPPLSQDDDARGRCGVEVLGGDGQGGRQCLRILGAFQQGLQAVLVLGGESQRPGTDPGAGGGGGGKTGEKMGGGCRRRLAGTAVTG